jgi:hypothetical protein
MKQQKAHARSDVEHQRQAERRIEGWACLEEAVDFQRWQGRAFSGALELCQILGGRCSVNAILPAETDYELLSHSKTKVKISLEIEE